MDSFEELGASAELVEALAAEGIERPTPLQTAAVPVVRKGNNLVLAAGPGSGVLVAWAAGLLDRLEPQPDAPLTLVLTPTSDVADRLAQSTSRMTAATGHSVAAIGGSWALPSRAHVLFGTASDVLSTVEAGRLSLASVRAVVIDQAQQIDALDGLPMVERVLDYVDGDAQRIVSALPMTAAVTDLAERHCRRAVTIPAAEADPPPHRGRIRFRIVAEPRESGTLAVVDEILADGVRHALVFTRSDDRAADLGDFLTLHGFVAGAPGDASVPVWLGVDALAARDALQGVEGVVVVSSDVPADPDTLDRRHAISNDGVVVVLPRELAHLKALGKVTGYETVPFPPPSRAQSAVDALRRTLERAIEDRDIAPYVSALEPLFERHDPTEVAAAAVALLRARRDDIPPPTPDAPPVREAAGATPAWAKLFVGVGERDGLRPGDLLGAITGEAGVSGDAVGRIDIKESHSLVEVHDAVAKRVIRAINGTTIKGRAVRADFDRPRRGSSQRGRSPR